MTRLKIEPIACLKDNYAWLLIDPATGATAVVDPSEEAPVAAVIDANALSLEMVLNTHHHWDHVGGNAGLRDRYGVEVLGPQYDEHRLKGLTGTLAEGDTLQVGQRVARVMHIPGHTTGHIALWFEADEAVFVGDTMFSMGCGRLFEGTPADMFQSFARLKALPDATRVYCGHEYTEANGRFAMTVDPDNVALSERVRRVAALRAQGLPTVPSTIAEEKATNPFLRALTVERFAELRRMKDTF